MNSRKVRESQRKQDVNFTSSSKVFANPLKNKNLRSMTLIGCSNKQRPISLTMSFVSLFKISKKPVKSQEKNKERSSGSLKTLEKRRKKKKRKYLSCTTLNG